MSARVAVVGAGLSGLACALELKRNNVSVEVFESTDQVGGRVKTDALDGFLLDHGFQVFLPAYEMGTYYLNYQNLKLNAFSPGAYIFKNDKFHTMSDPVREPSKAFATAFSSLATIKDKFLTLKLMLSKEVQYQNITSGSSALIFLKQFGFSERYIKHFFIPFFSGVFLNKELDVPSDYFQFLFGCFSKSYACLPQGGMASIPRQMAQEFGLSHIHLNCTVSAEELLSSGYDYVFVSHIPNETIDKIKYYGVKTEYYKTQSSKWASPTLYLNSNCQSVVNHVACLSAVNKNYSPDGWQLYSVNVLGDAGSKESRSDLIKMFGSEEVESWEHIKTFNVNKALPRNAQYGSVQVANLNNIFYCGDYLESPSIQGALFSGRKVARHFIENFKY